MPDPEAHYPDLGALIDQVIKRAKMKSQRELASQLDLPDYYITRAKKLDASAHTQLKVAKKIREKLANHLLSSEIEWLVQFEEWCKDQIDKITDESWADRWLRLQEAQEHGGVEQRKSTDDVSMLRPSLERPKSVPHFVLRYDEDDKNELNLILKDLAPGQIVTLCGPHGIGKTALATEVIRALAPDNKPPERFPDDIVFHNFYRYPSADSALYQIAKVFGDAEPGNPTPRDAARRALWNRRALLVLDGVEQCDDLDKILDVSGQCGVLITTTRRNDIRGKVHFVKTMPPDKSRLLLEAWSQVQIVDQPLAGHICKLVGYLPLALRIAGSYMFQRGLTASEYLELLKETPLEALTIEERQYSSVPLLIAKSLEHVSEAARRAIAVVGLLGLAPFDLQMVGVALEVSRYKAFKVLGELVSYSLLERIESQYQVSHSLIHTYVHTELTVPKEGLEKLAAYCTDLVEEERPSGYERLDVERAHLMAVLLRCRDRELWQATMRLAQPIGEYLNRLSLWTEHVAACEAGLAAARALNVRQWEGASLASLGVAYANLGQLENAIAYCEQALAISREINDRPIEGVCLAHLGLAYANLGQLENAIAYCEQALAISREINDRRGEGDCLHSLGVAYANLGQAKTAIEYYQQALVIARETGDRRYESKYLSNLGTAYANLGQAKTAIEYYQQALVIARETGDRLIEGACRTNLGFAHATLGQAKTAIEYYQQALVIARETGDRRGEGDCLHSLGVACIALRQVETAIGYFQQALVISREIKNRLSEGTRLQNLGVACIALGQAESAIGYLQQALVIARETGDWRNESMYLSNLGVAYANLGQAKTAIEYYQQALASAREIKDRRSEGTHLDRLGIAYTDLGQVESAIGYYQQALVIAREFKDRRNESRHLNNLGVAFIALGQVETAIGYYQQALVIAREFKDRRNESRHVRNLGVAFAALGQVETAIGYFQQVLVIARETGDRNLEAEMLMLMAWSESMLNDNEELATALLDETMTIYKSTKFTQGVVAALLIQGLIEWMQDRDPRPRWNEALSVVVSTGYQTLETLVRSCLKLLEGSKGVAELTEDLLQFSDREWRDMGLDSRYHGMIRYVLRAIATKNHPSDSLSG